MIRILSFIILLNTCRASSLLMRDFDGGDPLTIALDGTVVALGFWSVDYLARHAR